MHFQRRRGRKDHQETLRKCTKNSLIFHRKFVLFFCSNKFTYAVFDLPRNIFEPAFCHYHSIIFVRWFYQFYDIHFYFFLQIIKTKLKIIFLLFQNSLSLFFTVSRCCCFSLITLTEFVVRFVFFHPIHPFFFKIGNPRESGDIVYKKLTSLYGEFTGAVGFAAANFQKWRNLFVFPEFLIFFVYKYNYFLFDRIKLL